MNENGKPMFLTNEEISALTGKQRPSAQVRALRSMGVEHRRRPDGSVAVLRAHVERVFGAEAKATVRKKTQPDFSMVR